MGIVLSEVLMNVNQRLSLIHEREGVIRVALWFPSLAGSAWALRIERGGFIIPPIARRVMTAPGFKPGFRGQREIVILRSGFFSVRHRRTRRILRDAERRDLFPCYPDVACLLRESLSDTDFAMMGLRAVVALHSPIYVGRGQSYRLAADNGGGGRRINAFREDDDREWARSMGFAFEAQTKVLR